MKLCILSGGSAGIGAAAAARFVDAGYRVINLSRRPCPVAGVVSLAADFTDPGFLAPIADALREACAEADQITLLHNAGLLMNDAIGELDSAALRRALEVNVVASNTLNNLLLPRMPAGSCVLYVGSTLSEKAVAGTASYVIAKHAVIGMMRATCQDLVGRGIHTACICPGFTDTEMLREHIPGDVLGEIAQLSAFGRLIEPAEIAGVLLFAAHNPVLNGAVIHANLGQVER